jgi:CRISPR system Cascade subunit CasE
MPDPGEAVHAAHHLTWSLFNRAAGSEQRRNFLFREGTHGELYVLSEGRPNSNPVLNVESRELPLNFKAGDRLTYRLRANPTIKRGKTRIDVVMRELYPLSKAERLQRRADVTQSACLAWLKRQGEKGGFLVDPTTFVAEGYTQHRIRRRNAAPISLTTVDLSGLLTVADASLFARAIRSGIGSGRAYGCGLLLVRKVS